MFSGLRAGGLRSAPRQSGPDGAAVQGLLGSPQGHRQTRDEAGAEAKDVRLPQGLRGEDHHSEDCAPADNQQVGAR